MAEMAEHYIRLLLLQDPSNRSSIFSIGTKIVAIYDVPSTSTPSTAACVRFWIGPDQIDRIADTSGARLFPGEHSSIER